MCFTLVTPWGLARRYSALQLLGAGLITSGVMVAAAPPALWTGLGLTAPSGQAAAAAAAAVQAAPFTQVSAPHALMGVLCFAFPALASIVKV
jgi:hypothetical protein